MSDGKKHIRKAVLLNRRLLAQDCYQERNALLLANAKKFIKETSPSHVHCFLPIALNREPDTWQIIKYLMSQGIQSVVSATDFELQEMYHYLYSEDLVLENDRFGIPTPVNGTLADLQQVDLVFIPLLAADRLGNRVGYGKGYYDRLLPLMNPTVLKVGLNLCPAFDSFPFVEKQDVAMDWIVTPNEIIRCGHYQLS